MLRLPPSSPLFPYTTLFRSRSVDDGGAAHLAVGPEGHRDADATVDRGVADEDERADHPPSLVLDRKSTRLNSSHPSISYAVFCLKKKRRQSRTIQTRNSSRH